MALPATDNFNRTDGGLGSNWTAAYGALAILSNQVRPNNVGDEAGLYWNADTFAADQYSQATYAVAGANDAIGVAVRMSGSGATANYYMAYCDGATLYLGKVINGVWSQIGATDSGWAAGDLIRLEVEGTTLRVKRGSTTRLTATDSSISSGSAGLAGYNAFSAGRIDNWEGGNLSAGGAQTITATGLAHTNRFGSATVSVTGGAQTITAQGVPHSNRFGAATVIGPNQTIAAAGLAHTNRFGAAAISLAGGAQTIVGQGLPHTNRFGAASIALPASGSSGAITAPVSAPGAEYVVRWKSAAGVLRAIIAGATSREGRNGYLQLSYRKERNKAGRFQLVLPDDHPTLAQFADKDQVEVWRRNLGAGIGWYCDFHGIFRAEQLEETADGQGRSILSGPGALARLGWYHVLWPAGLANRTVFTAAKAETVIKALVQYNAVVADATTANGRDRQAPGYGIALQADAAGGNTISWNCGQRRNLLVELQELARIAGGDLDLIKTAANTWELRFYAGQRGTDKTATLVFARERGNLRNLKYSRNREREATAAIVGGQGEEALRRLRARTGAGYAAANDIETFVDARQAATDAELDAAGDAALDALRSRDQFSAELIQTPSCRYGPSPGHFELGDLVTVVYPRVGAIQQVISAIEVGYAPGSNPIEQVRGEFATR